MQNLRDGTFFAIDHAGLIGLGHFGWLSEGFIIREFIRIHADVIWLGINSKLDRFDSSSSQQHSLGHTMHAIHDAAVGRENNRKAQICRLDQADVLA